jgi:cell division protein FtsN
MASDQTTPPIDPPPEYLRQGRTDEPQEISVTPDPGRARRISLVLVASAIVVASASGMWFAYEQGVRKGVQMAPPLIRADNSPIKVTPDSPGGMVVPHQDKTVYDRLSGKPETVEAERLLPPPEVVVKKPEAVAEPEVAVSKPEETAAKEVPLAAKPTPEPEKAVVVAEEAPAVPVVPAAKPVSKPAPEPKVEVAKTAPAVVTKKNEPKQLQNKPGAHMIQVGAYRTAAKATTGWNRLVKANKALLGGLSPFVVRADLGSRGVFHRLRAGPVDGPEAAAALCSRLKQRKVGCLVIKP